MTDASLIDYCNSSWWGLTPPSAPLRDAAEMQQRGAEKEPMFTFHSLPYNTMRVVSQAG